MRDRAAGTRPVALHDVYTGAAHTSSMDPVQPASHHPDVKPPTNPPVDQTTMATDLPDHLTESILALLPLPSRILAHKVCKTWSGLVARLPPNNNNNKPDPNLWRLAGAEGDPALTRWLIQHRAEGFTPGLMDEAARNGHLDVVRLLHEHHPAEGGCTTHAMDWAAGYGHIDVVTFLHSHRYEGCTSHAMAWAATEGHLDVIRFLHEHRTEGFTSVAMDGAASNGHLDVVTFLHSHRAEGFTSAAMNGAASNGHLDVVTFLHSHRAEGCTEWGMNFAAARGHHDVVRLLRSQM
jgi:hypothetical protein